MAVIKAVSSKAGIGQAIDYVTKEEKTEEKLVSGLHCEAETAKEEMQATKELWEKTGGRTYKHFVQSYHKDEKITPEQAHRNALQLAENTPAWKGFEVLVATHKDKKHIHTHFIVNSVNFEDGHKLQWSSADLQELRQTSVAVVCAGAKMILDIGLTLEYLETMGVPVLGLRTDDFPAFYCRRSGFGVDHNAKDEAEIARIAKTKWDLGLAGGILIGNPVPEEYAMDFDEMTAVIEKAIAGANAEGVRGKNITPYLLAHIVEYTGGQSLKTNIQLAYNNARAAGKIAVAYAKL